MGRYRRKKKKDFSHEILGLVMVLATMAAFSPHFKDKLFSILKYSISIAVITGVIVVVYRMKKPRGVECSRYEFNSVPPPRSSVKNVSRTELDTEWECGSVNTDGAGSDEWAFSRAKESDSREWSIDLLRKLEWRRFEMICSEYLKFIGHDARETKIGPDGGVDIFVHKEGQERPVAIVQCKAWNTYKVGVKPIRELFGVMAAERIVNGMFIASGDYTKEALGFAEGKRLKLISGDKLVVAIKKLSAKKQEQLLRLALDGDYTSPTCPRCGIKMKVREASRGRNVGSKFWGCLNYPRCRSVLVYKQG